MMEKMIQIIKEKPIMIPRVLFSHYRELELTEKELIVLIELWNFESLEFNPKKMSEELGYSMPEILELTNSLVSKNCVSFAISKIENKRVETLDLSPLYNKLGFFIVNGKKETEEKSTNLFDTFEKEFGRTLSPTEYEIINGWLNGEFTEELVLCALKEAVFNGVSNLRYIDKILYEWKKKGIKNKEEVEKEKENFQNKKKEPKQLFDYDWLNE